jgi:tripartite ATP-independent transporter DctM subunit
MEAANGAVTFHRAWTRGIDRAIGAIVEPLAALLLLVEVVILGGGVFMRYVLHNPLIWSDELAGILMLWLSMLGAVIAYRRNAHIRVSAFIRIVHPNVARVLAVCETAIVALFAIELLPATQTFLVQESVTLTPTLAIPQSYVLASIVVALVLILVIAVLRLIDADPKIVLPVIVALVAVAIAAYAGRDVFAALGNLNLLVFLVVLVGILIAIGVPIAIAFGVGTVSYLALTTSVPLGTVVDRMNQGISNTVLLAVPLFVLLGMLIECAGISKRLVDAIASLVGHIRGGLGVALLCAMYLVSGISGSKIADMAAVAPALFPEMERRGQTRGEMVALLASSGAMAETIPPSLVLIIIGSVTGVSIAGLFAAGLVPAAIAAIFLIVVVLLRSRNDRNELARRPSLAWTASAFFVAIPGLVLPVLIRAVVLGGIATATEVSTVGIFYTVVVGVAIYREFDWRRLRPILIDTVSLTGSVMLIIATATAMAWAVTQSGFATDLATMLGAAPGGPAGFMAISVLVFVVLGSVLEGIPAIVLFGPLLFPIARELGINEIHYAIVAVLAMGIGLFSPPLGVGYYAACAIGKTDPEAAMPRLAPYMLAVLAATILVAAFPYLTLGALH